MIVRDIEKNQIGFSNRTRKFAKQVSSKHKFIAMMSCLQAVATIALGIWLCQPTRLGTIGVAWAALIPNVIVSVFFIFPVAFAKLKITVDIYN